MIASQVTVGHCLDVLRTLPDGSVQCCVTSPPYWGLRDYGLAPVVWGGENGCAHEWGETLREHQRGDRSTITGGAPHRQQDVEQGAFCQRCGAWRGQLGLEPTPELYVEHMVDVMREVRRVLRPDGTLWLNLGDSYASGKGTCYNPGGGEHSLGQERKTAGAHPLDRGSVTGLRESGLKPKDLVGIPWRVAFALQADGWWLRSDIIWAKGNPMPESVRDRPTRSHEYVFLLTKSSRYFYDAEAIAETATSPLRRREKRNGESAVETKLRGTDGCCGVASSARNARSVWNINTTPYRGAHFATMPPDLAERCIMAGTSAKGCCPKCGAPWQRVIEREKIGGEYMVGAKAEGNYGGQGTASSTLGSTLPHNERAPKTTTLGWRPTCGCPGLDGDSPGSACADADNWPTVPCLVLDPFGGAGTTGLAATRLGRSSLCIELNPEYAQMASVRPDKTQVQLFYEAR